MRGFTFWMKRDKGRPAARGGGRRVTGVETERSPVLRRALWGAAAAAGALALCWGGWALFDQYYAKSTQLFVLADVRRNVTVNAGKMVVPDIVYGILELEDGMNPFRVSLQEGRAKLMERMPYVKDLTIARRLPDRMTISITEREPIARVGTGADGRVVDEEGVVFVRYAGTGALPFIGGADMLEWMKEGDRLRGLPMAAVRLVHNAQRPEVRLRLLALEVEKDDYLLLTMSDHRQVKFAWEGMGDDEKDTVRQMQAHFDNLGVMMNSAAGLLCMAWDARVHGRITGTLPSVN